MTSESYFWPQETLYHATQLKDIQTDFKDENIRLRLLRNSYATLTSPYCPENEPLWESYLNIPQPSNLTVGYTQKITYLTDSPNDNVALEMLLRRSINEPAAYLTKPNIVRVLNKEYLQNPILPEYITRSSEQTSLAYSSLLDCIIVCGYPQPDDKLYFGRIWLANKETQLKVCDQLIAVSEHFKQDTTNLINYKNKLENHQAWVLQNYRQVDIIT